MAVIPDVAVEEEGEESVVSLVSVLVDDDGNDEEDDVNCYSSSVDGSNGYSKDEVVFEPLSPPLLLLLLL